MRSGGKCPQMSHARCASDVSQIKLFVLTSEDRLIVLKGQRTFWRQFDEHDQVGTAYRPGNNGGSRL